MSERRDCPPHYRSAGIEAADVCDAFELGRWETQAVQYVLRAKRKVGGERELEDIEKAIECLERVAGALRGVAAPTEKAVLRRLGGIPADVTLRQAGREMSDERFGLVVMALRSDRPGYLVDLDEKLPAVVEQLIERATFFLAQELIDAGWLAVKPVSA